MLSSVLEFSCLWLVLRQAALVPLPGLSKDLTGQGFVEVSSFMVIERYVNRKPTKNGDEKAHAPINTDEVASCVKVNNANPIHNLIATWSSIKNKEAVTNKASSIDWVVSPVKAKIANTRLTFLSGPKSSCLFKLVSRLFVSF